MVKIPSVTKPKTWKFGLQLHDAEARGRHFDLRIGDPKGNAHSWALQTLPEPGQWSYAIQQPTHTAEYMSFKGRIADSYGKGMVHSVRFEPTEVVRADNKTLKFHLHSGHKSEEFTLRRMGDGKVWKMYNMTITRERKPQIPSSKPKYREIPFDTVAGRLGRDNELMSVKIDGGHNTFMFESGKPLRIFSYRPTKRATGLIEHTHRVQKALGMKVPKALHGTVLRGELYARDKKTGKALPSQTIGGMLNANVWLSRERQKVHGPLRAAIFDVIKWRGKNVEKAPYAEKLKMLKEVKRHVPWLELPASAETSAAKGELLRQVMSNEHPQTREGVVFWDKTKGAPPVKAKIVQEHDVIIKGFQPGEGVLKGMGIGAVMYGTTQDPKEVKGKVGTGFSRAMRQHMHQNPADYVGKTMKVVAQSVFPSGALRGPRFKQMHLDTLEGGEKVAAPAGKVQETWSPLSLLYLGAYMPKDEKPPGLRRRIVQGAYGVRPGQITLSKYISLIPSLKKAILQHERGERSLALEGRKDFFSPSALGIRAKGGHYGIRPIVEEERVLAKRPGLGRPLLRALRWASGEGKVRGELGAVGWKPGQRLTPDQEQKVEKALLAKGIYKMTRSKTAASRLRQMHLDTLEGGEKVASLRETIQKIAARRGQAVRSAAKYSDDLYRWARRHHRRKKEREKQSQGTSISPGPTGFADQSRSDLPTSQLDNEGRLRTNDEPDAAVVQRSSAPKKKPQKQHPRTVAEVLMDSGDRRAGDYPGAEPLGVDRSFHANHENHTVG